jgi:putative metallohydrolase (TIGR04338 family)
VLGLLMRVLRTASSPRRRTRRSSGPRDTQRGRVYRWEAEHVMPHDRALLSLGSCQRLVDEVYRWAEASVADRPGWAPPEVTDGRGRRHACGSRQTIKLPRWARTRPVVLHECAHGLADDKHGPRFVARYVELLERFLALDRASLHASLARHRIRIAIAEQLLRSPAPAPRPSPRTATARTRAGCARP